MNEIHPNVVVRIPVVGIQRNGLLAFGDSVLKPAQFAERPTEKGVPFGGGKGSDRLLKQFGRFLVASGEM